jgi:FAD/FMN-containing dehydrogenase/Fe-S oxidoreductase
MALAMPAFERRLRSIPGCGTITSLAGRGRYATDASSYQVMPQAVAVPETMDAAAEAILLCREEGIGVTPRGAGTSQAGQTVNSGLIVDVSKHLNRVVSLDLERRRAVVEPGAVLDELNRALKPHGLWFPVDVSTASRATIGGMAANNSCGGRSLRYGTMRDNTISIEALLADGSMVSFGPKTEAMISKSNSREGQLFSDLRAIGTRDAGEIAARFPKVQRRVGGYNLDALVPSEAGTNFAHILTGSEGTLAFFKTIEIALWPIMGPRAVGVCHFGSFYEAMNAAQHLVTLGPIAIELVDRTMIALARDIPIFRSTVEAAVRGDPEALLLVEFAEDEAQNRARILELNELMGDLGFGWDKPRRKWGGVVDVFDPQLQTALAAMRTSGLNIMMSMKDEGKPVSFVEDCAVPLAHLADYTQRLSGIFERHGTSGTWYAHASVGCLHVRPILNLKLDKSLAAMRPIAEEAFALVREYKGSHSGEHGDGIARSEFHEAMFGSRLVRAFEEVKDRFDPSGLFNPGRIVRAPRFDDREFLRFNHGYGISKAKPALDWKAYPGGAGGFQGAAEMCNNNGACRNLAGDAMCPSYRVTRDEKDVTRGRANTLRLALSGQLGPGALASDEMADTLSLCVSCKACRRECPAGVDMARMKIEVQAARASKYGIGLMDRLVAELPRYANLASRLPFLMNLRNRVQLLGWLGEILLGFSRGRKLPIWRRDVFSPAAPVEGRVGGKPVVLFADTFNRYFERENLEAAATVLKAANYRVHHAQPLEPGRPLCCGRTYLSAGLVEKARCEMRRTIQALEPHLKNGTPIIGLEPSCILTFRDELQALLPEVSSSPLGEKVQLFEEFIAAETESGGFAIGFEPRPHRVMLHGHCHQKAFGVMDGVMRTLDLIPGMEADLIGSSCCGMAGSFGYRAGTAAISLAMAELSLFPAIRAAPGTTIAADGFSCRHQIRDGLGRSAVHVAQVLVEALPRPVREAAGRI